MRDTIATGITNKQLGLSGTTSAVMSLELGLSMTMLEIREIHHTTKRSSVTSSRAFQAAFATTSDDAIFNKFYTQACRSVAAQPAGTGEQRGS